MPRRIYTTEQLMHAKFYHLELLEEIRKNNRIYWKCKCDCGKIILRPEKTIINHDTQSCGCQHPRHKKSSEHPLWKGCGELNGQYFAQLRKGAENRNIKFNISIEEAWNVFLQQDGKCALTNLSLTFAGARDKAKGIAIQTASLDRIDPNKPYIKDNIQWVHKDINKMKNNLSQERLIELAKLISLHQ
jgi:hypothetical protein